MALPAIDYSNPVITKYEYTDGFDKDWISKANISGVFYPKLPHVVSINFGYIKILNKQWSEEKNLILTINPPFWLSGAIIFGSFLFLTFLFMFYAKARLNIVKAAKRFKKIIADERLTKLREANKDLKKQKNDIESKIEDLKNLSND